MENIINNPSKRLAFYSQSELDALWEELKEYNEIGPWALDFVREMQKYNAVYNYILIRTDSYIGQFSKKYISNDYFCLAA